MRVLIVNTSEKTGGAALASNRLMRALNHEGVKAKMLVRDKQTHCLTVEQLPNKWLSKWHFLWERWCIFWHLRFSRKQLFTIDIANCGTDITQLPEFKAADIIQLEWINQGMLSLDNIEKILKSGKPVVWTMHDIWPATGICHYTRGCEAFKTGCQHCKLLPNHGSKHDLSTKVWDKKKEIYSFGNLQFVTCSEWLAQQAKQSGLISERIITSIPNPIDTSLFHSINKQEARQALSLPQDQQIILFVSQKVTDERKGVGYFIQAINYLTQWHLQQKPPITVAILGNNSDEVTQHLKVPTISLGYVSDPKTIVNIYNAADIFVLPSLEDNLPNTIMEAMACGVPCVGFDIGGIPEMINHRENGFVADFKEAKSLAEGINWVLSDKERHEELSRQCIKKVHKYYAQNHIAQRYIQLYEQALAPKIKQK